MSIHKIAQLIILLLLWVSIPNPAHASAVDDLLARYKGQGAGNFNATTGKALWNKTFKDTERGQERSCATCHHSHLGLPGKHAQTGKAIDPMAPSVNSKRLTDVKFIEKWFTRNCKWTMGRECTPEEKGNFLLFIKGQ